MRLFASITLFLCLSSFANAEHTRQNLNPGFVMKYTQEYQEWTRKMIDSGCVINADIFSVDNMTQIEVESTTESVTFAVSQHAICEEVVTSFSAVVLFRSETGWGPSVEFKN